MVAQAEKEILFKVLGPQGSACNGGNMFWNLPQGNQPGHWHELPKGEKAIACKTGFHLTNTPAKWEGAKEGKTVWIAEGGGQSDRDGDKTAFQRARLVCRATFDAIAERLGFAIRVIAGVVNPILLFSGYGYGYGYGDGYGDGYGYGYGDGDGYGDGYGYGYGDGDGYGYGDGDGYGDGYGYGYGYGDGDGDGYGDGYGDHKKGEGYPKA